MTATNKTAGASGKGFVSTRVFDAPRALVWQTFTQIEHLKHWWGPKGFTMLSCTIDLRVGGLFHYGMEAPNGMEMWGKWVFREIMPMERLVALSSFSDKDGGLTRHPLAPDWPQEMLGTTTFLDEGSRTRMSHSVFAFNATETERKTFEAGFDSMTQGFGGTWDQLDAYLAKKPSAAG